MLEIETTVAKNCTLELGPTSRKFCDIGQNTQKLLLKMCVYVCLDVIQADPYIRVTLGKTEMTNREEYVPNSIQPYFGASVVTHY